MHAEYMDCPGDGTTAAIEDTTTMRAGGRASKYGRAARVSSMGPAVLSASMSRETFAEVSSITACWLAPAHQGVWRVSQRESRETRRGAKRGGDKQIMR